jgi:hypothetical protein
MPSRITVMSPEAGLHRAPGGLAPRGGGAKPSSPSFAPRLDTLESKTLYLVDIGFSGGDQFMAQLQKWFGEHMPAVTTIRKRKPGHVFGADDDVLWEEVKAKGDAVVLGVAG